MRMDRIRVGPFRYLYLDAIGIDSLYAQTVEFVEAEITTSSGKKRSSKIGGKASLGQTLSKVFRLPELAVETDLDHSTDSSEVVKAYRTAEQKLAVVIRHLEQLGPPSFYSDLHAAAEYSTSTGQSTYVCMVERFDLPGFRNGPDAGIELINRQGAMVFEKDQLPEDRKNNNNYKRRKRVPITMAASLSNFPEVRGNRLGMTSHLSILLRGLGGVDLPLWVFGSFLPLKTFFQIKPYAIWV